MLANSLAPFETPPIIIRDGYKLSSRAKPSRKNSGEKIILLVFDLFLILWVKPTGTVDLITKVALGFINNTSEITVSTDLVLKELIDES